MWARWLHRGDDYMKTSRQVPRPSPYPGIPLRGTGQTSRVAEAHEEQVTEFLCCHLPRSTGKDRHPPQQGLVFALLINLYVGQGWLQQLFSLCLTAFSFKTRHF